MRLGLVNDLPLALEALRRCIVSDPGLSVAWTAANGAEAVSHCRRDLPDLVLMDLFMPVMSGVDATRQIMSATPCPILVVTASVQGATQEVFAALSAGALDVVDTPCLSDADNALGQGAQRLLTKLRSLNSLIARADATPGASVAKPLLSPLSRPMSRPTNAMPLVALGASTGGPAALVELLRALHPCWTLQGSLVPAVVVIQHLEPSSVPLMMAWLSAQCKLPVDAAKVGASPQPGRVYVATQMSHLLLSSRAQFIYREEPVAYPYRPSVDEFFLSCRHWGGPVLAALLTGLGADGAKGLSALRQRGSSTWAQTAETCVVNGMPRAALRLDPRHQTGSPSQIGSAMFTQLQRGLSP